MVWQIAGTKTREKKQVFSDNDEFMKLYYGLSAMIAATKRICQKKDIVTEILKELKSEGNSEWVYFLG